MLRTFIVDSYSKIGSFGSECYKETIVAPSLRKPQLQWNKSFSLIISPLHHSIPVEVRVSGEQRQKHSMLTAWIEA